MTCPLVIFCSIHTMANLHIQALEQIPTSLMHKLRKYASSVALRMSMSKAQPISLTMRRQESMVHRNDSISVGEKEPYPLFNVKRDPEDLY